MTLRLLPIHITLFYISNHQRAAFYSPFDHQSHKRTVPFKWYHLNPCKINIFCLAMVSTIVAHYFKA